MTLIAFPLVAAVAIASGWICFRYPFIGNLIWLVSPSVLQEENPEDIKERYEHEKALRFVSGFFGALIGGLLGLSVFVHFGL